MAAPAPGQLRPYRAYKERRPKSQLAGGAPIHKNVAYVRSAAPRNLNRRGTGGYIGNKTAIVKARFFTESLRSASCLVRTSQPHETEPCWSVAFVFSMRFSRQFDG